MWRLLIHDAMLVIVFVELESTEDITSANSEHSSCNEGMCE